MRESSIRLIFMGSSDFSVPILEALTVAGYQIGLVVTQPDKPRGRSQKLAPTPVKTLAGKLGLPIYQPSSIRLPEAVQRLASVQPDLAVTASYGQILRNRHLAVPRYGTLNVHASLLPELRGASPIQAAILEGKSRTGCTIMLTERGIDSGPVLSSQSIPLPETETAGTLQEKLALLGAKLLVDAIPAFIDGSLQPIPQDHTRATFTRPLSNQDGLIDWSRSAIELSRQIRAMNPCPGAFTSCGDQRLKIYFATPYPGSDTMTPPGSIIGCIHGKGCLVQTGTGILLCEDLQPACRKRMRGDSLLQGRFTEQGAILGTQSLTGESVCPD